MKYATIVVSGAHKDGLDPFGTDAEDGWLPIVGPTAWSLLRYAYRTDEAERYNEHYARAIGVKGSRIKSAFRTLERFNLCYQDVPGGPYFFPANVRRPTPADVLLRERLREIGVARALEAKHGH